MLNNVFDELLDLIDNRLVVIIIKDFIPLCFLDNFSFSVEIYDANYLGNQLKMASFQ